MRETEGKSGWAKNKPVGSGELEMVPDEEDPRYGADEQAIPDYVMWDFGLPEKEECGNGIRT